MKTEISRDTVARKKAKLQASGIKIPYDVMVELEAKFNAPSVRTGRLVFCLPSTDNETELSPVFVVNGKHSVESPYHLEKINSRFEVWENENKYTDIVLMPRPRFYDYCTSDNVPMNKVGVIVAPGHLRTVVNQKCFYQEVGKACKFCAVQYWWNSNVKKTISQVFETIVAGVKEREIAHVSLTTATSNAKDKGLLGLVECAQMISSEVKIPMMIEFEPFDDLELLESLIKKARSAGVITAFCNIECFDPEVRHETMPLKGMVSINTYLKAWHKCIEIFGKNEVYTVVVVGIGESDESILEGVEMAASHGVITFLVPHSPAIGAIYEDMESPHYDRLLHLYEKANAIYLKYGLNIWASGAGCARGGAFSGLKEVSKYGI